MKNTTIQWRDHTVNFWWGCTKVSPACEHCYAESLAKVFGKRLFGKPIAWGKGQERGERLEAARAECVALNKQAVRKGLRYRVFINSMSDWLDDEVPAEWLAALLQALYDCPQIDFQLLTKRPENWRARMHASKDWRYRTSPDSEPSSFLAWLHRWSNGTPPPNLWIGTTVEDQTRADQRIPALLQIPARVRFLSCEPLLGPISLLSPLEKDEEDWHGALKRQGIHWVIAGGESGGQARPSHPAWMLSLHSQCYFQSVPFFFKQWGEWLPSGQVAAAELPPKMKGLQCITRYGPTVLMLRAGTKAAGNLLDGKAHLNFPTP